MTRRSAFKLGSAVVALAVLCAVVGYSSACSSTKHRIFEAIPGLDDVETSLFLIGDAGNPGPEDPVLKALSRELSRDPEDSVAVFLGDNIYPHGLPSRNAPDRQIAETRLDRQIETVTKANGAQGVFIPGNHDWDQMGPGGWDAIKRQGDYIEAKGNPLIELLPRDGCPGPIVRDYDTRLRLIILDTQWWLHGGAKPKGPKSDCVADTEGEVLDGLSAALQTAGDRATIVVGHHPIASSGLHGGYFQWRDHIFPLRAKKSWLWIPLPGVGSAYPMARRRGVSDQDLSGTRNRKMREALEGVFSKTAPLIYAAGHDHNLEVLKGQDVKFILVSGAGYFNHLTATRWSEASLFAQMASGFMRIDFSEKGNVRLGVYTVDAEAKLTEAFSQTLK